MFESWSGRQFPYYFQPLINTENFRSIENQNLLLTCPSFNIHLMSAFLNTGRSDCSKYTDSDFRFRPGADVQVSLIRIVFAITTSYDELSNVISRLADFNSRRILSVRSNIPRN